MRPRHPSHGAARVVAHFHVEAQAAARFCPACGQALIAMPHALAEPTVTMAQVDAAAPVNAPFAPAPTPPRPSLRWGWWLLAGLFTLLVGLIGGGWLWLEHTASAPLPAPASAAAAAPAAPIELAPGLTLQERRPVETPSQPPATPAVSARPAPAAALATATITPPLAPPAVPVTVAPVKPAATASPATASPAPANPEANRRQTPAPPSQTFQPPPEAAAPPAAPIPAPARPNAQPNTQALHDEILRRKEALKQQMGVE